MRDRLTAKQEAFCVNYFTLKHAGKAALQAGYSQRTAPFIGSENLQKPQILARISELQAAVASEAIATVEERQKRLTEFIRADLVDFLPNGEPVLTRETPHHGAASEFRVTTRYDRDGAPVVTKAIKLRDPIAAISELNKMEHVYEERPPNAPVIQTFIFVLPDGTQVSPGQLLLKGDDDHHHSRG